MDNAIPEEHRHVVDMVHWVDSRSLYLRYDLGLIFSKNYLGGPNGLPPLAHHNRAITESLRESEIPGPKHFCDLCRNILHHENSDHLMSFKTRGFDTFHFCDLCRRCTGTENISESLFFDFLISAPRMTGRRSHWTERGDDNIVLRLAIVMRLFLLWLRMGLVSWDPLVRIIYTQVRRSIGRNDKSRAEKQNVVLTWFRPVTWSSGHLGRR